jgi:hypothetical protein
LELVVQELILGPTEIRHGRLLPRGTKISSLAVEGYIVYVDLSPDMVFGEQEVRVGVEEGLRGIKESLLYNFRWLEDVVLTIGGQEPFHPPFSIPDRPAQTAEDSSG